MQRLDMQIELESASNFILAIMELENVKLSKRKKSLLQQEIINVMKKRYHDHWFPEKPYRQSGYRRIKVDKQLDPVLVQACDNCGISPGLVRSALPNYLIMRIDPFSVCYQIGVDGEYCELYKYKSNYLNIPWTFKNYTSLM